MSKIEINGSENHVFQNVKNSNINSTTQTTTKVSPWVKYSAIIGTISMIIAAIANWEKIIRLFQ